MRSVILLLVLAMLAGGPAFAQKKKKKSSKKKKDMPTWFFAQVGGGFGNSLYLNNNASVEKDLSISPLNISSGFRGKIGANLSFGVGAAIEFGPGSHGLKYTWTDSVSGSETSNSMKFKTFDFAILLRKVSPTNGYVEIGLHQFSSIKSQTNSDSEVNNQFNAKYTSLVFGFGGPIYYHEKFDINAGLRVAYSLSDLMQTDHYPFAADYTIDPSKSYTSTKMFDIQLQVGFCYHIGYFQQAKCDGHLEFLMF